MLHICFALVDCALQIGCRLLQLKLDQGDPTFVDKICGEAQPYLADMMKVFTVHGKRDVWECSCDLIGGKSYLAIA